MFLRDLNKYKKISVIFINFSTIINFLIFFSSKKVLIFFDKELFINDPDFTYEEIDPKIKLKWYHLLSYFIRYKYSQKNRILAYSNKIRKVTYKG